MHRLGVTAPSHDSVRINSVLALKTMLMPVVDPGGFVHFPLGKSDECRDTSNHDCRCDRSIERWISPTYFGDRS
jgi:hypothetical protein